MIAYGGAPRTLIKDGAAVARITLEATTFVALDHFCSMLTALAPDERQSKHVSSPNRLNEGHPAIFFRTPNDSSSTHLCKLRTKALNQSLLNRYLVTDSVLEKQLSFCSNHPRDESSSGKSNDMVT